MKGWPLLQAAMAFLALLAVGLPLRFLTAARAPVSTAPPPTTAEEKITIALTFTQPAIEFSLKYLGREIVSGGDSVAFDSSTTLNTRFPAEGIDLVFEGKWPEHFRKVGVSIEVIREDGTKQSQTLWGTKEIFEVLTFPGKADP